MSRRSVLFFGLAACVLLLGATSIRGHGDHGDGEEVDEKDVFVMTNDNFDEAIKKHKFALVEFYAPWCGHCKALKPEYAKAATELKGIDDSILIAKVDATEQKELGEKFGVKGYPTLKWFVDGVDTEYNGGRQAADILRWIKKKTGPPAVDLTADKLEDLLDEDAPIILAYFDKLEGEDYAAFEDAARMLEDADAYQTTDAKLAKEFGLTKPGFAIARKAFGEWEYVQSEGSDAFKADEDKLSAKIGNFFKNEIVPVYMAYSQDSHQKIFGAELEYYVFLFGTAEQLAAAEKDVLKPLAAGYKGKAMLVGIDLGDANAKGIANYFMGDDKPEELTIMGWEKAGGKKYKGPAPVTKDAFKAWADELVAGTAQAFFKSEDVPAENPDADGVTKVVGKNFDEVVFDKERDVLLEIYAPWCGHCKTLAPIYKKLGKRFKKVDSMVIAQVDGTANEHDKLTFQGFPTIMFYPAGEDKEPISYTGDRSLKDLTKFLKKSAAVPFELPKKSKKSEEGGEDAAGEDEDKHDEL